MNTRGSTVQFSLQFTIEECYSCGVPFAMTDDFIRQKREARGTQQQWFYCPNGHSQYYTAKSDAQRAREAEEEANRQRGLAQLAEQRARNAETTAKRERTRRTNIEKRVAAGICPKCHRRFRDLADHFVTKHGGAPEEIARVIAERRGEEHAHP